MQRKRFAAALLDLLAFVRHNICTMLRKTFFILFFLLVPLWRFCSAASIEVKFPDDSGVHLKDNQLYYPDGNQVLSEDILECLGPMSIHPVFSRAKTHLQSERVLAMLLSNRPHADLTQYFHMRVLSSNGDAALHCLNHIAEIEKAVLLPDRVVPCAFDDTTPDFSSYQEYLFDDTGPHLARAWEYPGGKGESIAIVLIESNCNRFHEDLVHRLGMDSAVLGGIPGGLPGAMDHGSAVAGMLIASDNGFGITGICHQASLRLYFAPAPELIADAIDICQASLSFGDIILVEMQVPGPFHQGDDNQYGMVPVEYIPSVYDAVSLASTLGRIVILPAGNGSQNLDDPIYEGIFDPAVRDSGAVFVGAGKPADRAPVNYTNYGTRVNLQGWAERMNPCCQVWSTGYGNAPNSPADPNRSYTDRFSGTSSASAMVAGAAACLQGALQFRTPDKLPPDQIRNILIETGFPQTGTRHIGPLPDIMSAIETVPIAGVTTDLHLNKSEFTAFDPFVLDHQTINPHETRAVIKYLALQCLSDWFFFRCDTLEFVPFLQGCPEILYPGTINEVLLSFTWPSGDFGKVYPDTGFAFYLVFLDLFDGSLLSNVDSVSFGWY